MSHLDAPAAPRLPGSRSRLSQSERLLRPVLGAVGGTVLFLGVAHRLPLTSDLLLSAGVFFVAVCVLASTWSTFCRCWILLVFPSMLSSRGQTYLLLFILSVLGRGPVANIQHNVQQASLSLSCNLDLQVAHSRQLWRETFRPVLLVAQALMDDEAGLKVEAQNVSRGFQGLRDDVMGQYGYQSFRSRRSSTSSSSQELFASKTRMQCDTVVGLGVQRCSDWFSQRWAECMRTIPVPVINHILCVSMKFNFLCDVLRVMTPWCRQQIPVEGNFGRLFDQLDASIQQLSSEFSAEVEVQEQRQQEVLQEESFSGAVEAALLQLQELLEQLLLLLQLLISCTFVTIFTQAFGYLRCYLDDLHFDNIYVTALFRQIDARRRRAGRRHLLPLTPSERKKLIEPLSLKICPEERHLVVSLGTSPSHQPLPVCAHCVRVCVCVCACVCVCVCVCVSQSSGVAQVLSVALLTVVLLTVDLSLFHVLDVVNAHTVTNINLTSRHQVDIRVGGDSMMARLLRRTVSAFNSSSNVNVTVDNSVCVSAPSSLSAATYVLCVSCILLVALFSCLQVYTNRLRHCIAAFFFPEVEATRIFYLYHLQLQRRFSSRQIEATRGRSCCWMQQEATEEQSEAEPAGRGRGLCSCCQAAAHYRHLCRCCRDTNEP